MNDHRGRDKLGGRGDRACWGQSSEEEPAWRGGSVVGPGSGLPGVQLLLSSCL